MGVPFTIKPNKVQVDYNDEFVNQYCHTDIIPHLDQVTTDHRELGKKSKLRLKVNAVKKLLPYNGFYPSQRVLQLASLFKDSYRNSITLKNPSPPYNRTGQHPSQALQSLLQPFFAPGLLFNTIKSGIAVDYPIFTNDTGLEPHKPRPLVDAFDQDNKYVSKKIDILAPSWYCDAPKSYTGRITDESGDLPLPEDSEALQELKVSQPKYNSMVNSPSSEGFVIIKEPSTRLSFEKLLDIESAFYTEGGLNNLVINPTQGDKTVFQNTILEIIGFECEENVIVLRQPTINAAGLLDADNPKEHSIYIKHESNGTVPRIERNIHNQNEATLWVNFDGGVPEAEVSADIDEQLVEYINNNDALHFVAINDSTIITCDDDPACYRDIDNAFALIEPEIGNKRELSVTNISRRIKIIYTGPLVLTFKDIINIDGVTPELMASIISSDLAFSGTTWADALAQAEVTPAAKKFYFSDLNSSLRLDGSLFTTNSKCVAVNGHGNEAKVTLRDTGRIKKGLGADGVLGVKYVHQHGSTIGESDNPNYYPMFQTLKPFYNGKLLTEDESGVSSTSLGSIKVKKKPHQIFLMAPSYYTGSINEEWIQAKRYPFFEWNGQTASPLYKMAMHNFLAETPKFFLKNKGMTTLASKPAGEFNNMVIGRTYYMDLVMYKTDNFDMTVSPYNGQTITHTSYPGVADPHNKGPVTTEYAVQTQGRYYGPAFKYKNNDFYKSNIELNIDPAYAPSTPPYFYGKTIGRISYTATKTNPTIDEIHAGMSIEYIDDGSEFVRAATANMDAQYTIDNEPFGIKDSPAYKAKMKLEASINFKGKTRIKNVTYDVSDPTLDKFQAKQATDSTSKENDVWVISTKFECPMLNFNPLVTKNSASIDDKNITTPNNTNTRGTGMWHGYGKISNSEGVFLSLEESFKTFPPVTPNGEVVGSLIDVCGFKTQNSRLGEVATETKISEAIIMVPFVDDSIKGQTISKINKNVFRISNEMFQLQKTNIEQGKPAIDGEETIQETSISRMIKLMKKYYIPPELDFLTHDKEPMVMYIFEFNHTFDQQDLSNIWQGVLPKIGTTARRSDDEDDNEIVHNLGPYDLFEGQQLPDNMRWLVFKVKQKGEKNYYNVTADSKNDERFKFNFKVGKQTPDYSYNWPYDFFSLVELANIEGGIIIESDEDE